MPSSIVSIEGLSRNRRLVRGIVELAEGVPRYPVERRMDLAGLAEARLECRVRIGWVALFTKAYAMVAREAPVLRSWFVPGWRPRVATAAQSVASIAVSRPVQAAGGGRTEASAPTCPVGLLPELYFGQIRGPERLPLEELQERIARFATGPVEEVFRRQRQLSMLPLWAGRMLLGWNVRSRSFKRALRLGTFSVSSLAGEGASNRFHPSFLTTSLTFSPLEDDHTCLVTLLCDHRLLDGVPAARALAALERTLSGPILSELRAIGRVGASADPRAA